MLLLASHYLLPFSIPGHDTDAVAIINNRLHPVLLLNPRSHVEPPGDGNEERPRHVDGLDRVGRDRVQDVRGVDAVRTRREGHEGDEAEAHRGRLGQGGAEHRRRGRLPLPVGVQHHWGGGYLGGGCGRWVEHQKGGLFVRKAGGGGDG